MKIPQHIKNKMHRIVALNRAADKEMEIVEKWLEKQGFDIETLRNGDGCSLEELEYGNDITDEFCARIEAEKAGEQE